MRGGVDAKPSAVYSRAYMPPFQGLRAFDEYSQGVALGCIMLAFQANRIAGVTNSLLSLSLSGEEDSHAQFHAGL